MDNTETRGNCLAPFVPNLILEWFDRYNSDKSHKITEHEGLLCFLDASGFTRLTSLLGGYGKEGPEILTGILNGYFDILTEEIFDNDGDILKFAGDAVWAFFPQMVDIAYINASIREKLSKINREYEILHKHPLEIHSGAEWGKFHLISMGRSEVRLEPEMIGEAVRTTFRAAEFSGPGELVVGPGLAEKLVNEYELQALKDGFFRLGARSSKQNPKSIIRAAGSKKGSEVPDRSIEPYISGALLARVKSTEGYNRVESEFRTVTVLFVNFEYQRISLEDINDTIYRHLNEPIEKAFEIIRATGGSIARIDPSESGHKLMILFGAPSRRTDDELHAVHCASKLVELSESRFRIRIGMARGSLFCGEVGTERRKEYTVMGDSANLAARLMALAKWGEVLFDGGLKENLPGNILSKEREVLPKGYEREITAFKLTGITEASPAQISRFPLVGRTKELSRLNELWNRVKSGHRETMIIYGDSGIGKSSLISGWLDEVDGNSTAIECRHSVLFGNAWLARKLIAALYRSSPVPGRTPLIEFIKSRIDSAWWPILAELIGISAEDNDWTRGLSPELRIAKAGRLFNELVSSLVKEPCVVFIDDFDRADEYSRRLLKPVMESPDSIPLMLILVQERAEFEYNSESIQTMDIKAPDLSDWRLFFKDILGNGKRERELTDDLLRHSGGNPYFISEFIGRSVAQKSLVPNRISGKLEISSGTVSLEIPSKTEELQLSRFDHLDETERTVLKAGSAVRGEFTAELIAMAIPEIENIPEKLQDLFEYGILNYDPENVKYAFSHNSMRDVVYSCIPQSTLRKWHALYAFNLEKESSNENRELIGYHFYKAKDWPRAFNYYIDAAEAAVSAYSLNSAFRLFERCWEILEHIEKSEIDIAEWYRYFSGYSELLILDGRFDDTYAVYRRWRHTARENRHTEECLRAAVKTGSLLWKQSKYKSCRKVITALLESPALGSFPVIEAKVLAVMGELDRRAGDFNLAQDHCRQAAEIAEREGDYQTVADAYNNLGLALWGAGKLEEAAECYRRCLVTAREYYGKYMLAQSSNNLAIIYWEQGDFIAADNMLSEALTIFRNIGDRRNEAYTAGNLSSIHRISGKFVSARRLLMEADLVFERLDDRHAHHYVIGNIGDIDLIEGSLEGAERHYRMAAEFADGVGDRELAAECEVRFGDLAFFRFELEKAEKIYLSAVRKAEEIGSAEYGLRAKIGLARLHIRNRDAAKALQLIEEIKQIAAENHLIILSNEADFLLGEKARIENNNNAAVEYFKKVIKYARNQKIFELTLKCAVRIYDLAPSEQDWALSILTELSKYVISENHHSTWQTVVNSAYFAHFSRTLKVIENRKNS